MKRTREENETNINTNNDENHNDENHNNNDNNNDTTNPRPSKKDKPNDHQKHHHKGKQKQKKLGDDFDIFVDRLFDNHTTTDEKGRTLLLPSLKQSILNIFRKLFDVTGKKEKRLNPLLAACYLGDVDLVKTLINEGEVSPWKKFHLVASTAELEMACRGGHGDVVRLLIDEGAKTSIRDYRRTPLHQAC